MGMLIPEFPSQTHAFFWREIQAWRTAGVAVEILSTRRPPPEACQHEFAAVARRETHYLFPPTAGSAIVLAGWPRGLARATGYIRSLSEASAGQKLRLLGLLPSAAKLAALCRERQIPHVHCHSFADAAHLCAMAHLLGGPTYSLTLHGDLPVYGVDHAAKLKHCTAVTTAGSHLIEPVAALGFPRERILSNPMGVDTARFTPTAASAIAADGMRPGATILRLITVARLNRNKGHRFALAAMRRLAEAGTEVSYTIVGEGPHRQDVEAEVARLDLGTRVSFAGSQGEDRVLEMLREHHVFLLPSVGLGEAAPVSVMEAMSCGLPVIASEIGSTPDMVRHGQTGFLTPQEDVEAIAKAIGTLATDERRRGAMGLAAREYAAAHFDARQSSLRLLEHIQRVTRG